MEIIYPHLIALGSSFLAFYILWIFYLAVMNLARAHEAGTLKPIAYKLGIPILVVGYILDVLINWTLLTIMFLEPPYELTVSARLSRHFKAPTGYRRVVSVWICANLLDTFDTSGTHCR